MQREGRAAVLDRQTAAPLVVGGDAARWLAGELGADHVARSGAGQAGDPYGVGELVASMGDVDALAGRGVLVVASKRRGAATAVPAPVVDGVPIGIVFGDTPADLGPWLSARAHRTSRPRTEVIVASMYHHVYEAIADDVLGLLGPACDPVDLRSRHHGRGDLLDALESGPGVLMYIGHGRWRGWSGYRGVRWPHVERSAVAGVDPVGLIISLACDVLKRPHGHRSFGGRFVASGRAAALIGSATKLRIDEGFRLCDVIAATLATRPRTVGELLTRAHERSIGRPVASELAKLRLVGSPDQSLAVDMPRSASRRSDRR